MTNHLETLAVALARGQYGAGARDYRSRPGIQQRRESPYRDRLPDDLTGQTIIVEADQGRVEIVAAGRNEDLNTLLEDAGATLDGPAQYVERWGRYTPEVTASGLNKMEERCLQE